MNNNDFFLNCFIPILHNKPDAEAHLHGSADYPGINGTVRFYVTPHGVLVCTQVSGLPDETKRCKQGVFGFHIHSGKTCTGTPSDPFADSNGHYNPNDCPHPYHAGDMPPLFEAHGSAFSVFLSGRFTVEEIIGRTVIIHASPDDFMSQPSGNSGTKIACGQIRPVN